MQIKFELANYDEALDKFALDETIYEIEISEEDAQTYELLKSSDLNLYNWFKESDFFLNYIREEVYPDSENIKFAICDINDISFRRFFFFKVTSAESHYDYFKNLFTIFEESEWQDREDVGRMILEQLVVKRQELVIELKVSETVDSSDGEV